MKLESYLSKLVGFARAITPANQFFRLRDAILARYLTFFKVGLNLSINWNLNIFLLSLGLTNFAKMPKPMKNTYGFLN